MNGATDFFILFFCWCYVCKTIITDQADTWCWLTASLRSSHICVTLYLSLSHSKATDLTEYLTISSFFFPSFSFLHPLSSSSESLVSSKSHSSKDLAQRDPYHSLQAGRSSRGRESEFSWQAKDHGGLWVTDQPFQTADQTDTSPHNDYTTTIRISNLTRINTAHWR